MTQAAFDHDWSTSRLAGQIAGQDPPSSAPALPLAAPAPTPAAEAPGTPGPPADSGDRTDARGLLTATEIGAVIGGAAKADTPTLPGASGCEYRAEGAGNQPYVDVTYAQADGNGVYASLLASAGQGASGATTDLWPGRASLHLRWRKWAARRGAEGETRW